MDVSRSIPSPEEILRAVATIAVHSVWRGNRRPSRQSYHQACALVTRYRVQARQAAEIALNARGRRALEMVLGVYRVVTAQFSRIAGALARRIDQMAEVALTPSRLFAGDARA